MKVNLTTNEILNIATVLESLIPDVGDKPKDAVTAFKLTRILKVFVAQKESIQEQVNDLQKAHMIKDEEGEPVTEEITEGPNKGQTMYKIDVDAYNKDLGPILKTSMDIELPFVLGLNDLQKEYEIDYQKLFVLDKILEI